VGENPRSRLDFRGEFAQECRQHLRHEVEEEDVGVMQVRLEVILHVYLDCETGERDAQLREEENSEWKFIPDRADTRVPPLRLQENARITAT